MNNTHSFFRTFYQITFVLFLLNIFILISGFIYYSEQNYENKTKDIIENNFDSFNYSLIYMDSQRTISNTLQSLMNAGRISSFSVSYNESIIGQGKGSFNCKIIKNILFKKNYKKNHLVDGEIYLGNYLNGFHVCYEKYFYNKSNKKFGSVEVSVPIKKEYFKDFFFFSLATIILFFSLYVFVIFLLKKYFKILSNSIILTHDFVAPLNIIKNKINSDYDIDKKSIINLIESMKALIKHNIDKYIYNKDNIKNYSFFSITEVIEECFFAFIEQKNFNVKYHFEENLLNLKIKTNKEDFYLVIINLIKNAIESVKKNQFDSINFVL